MKFNPILPEFYVSDYPKSLHFYTEILGFQVEYDRPSPLFAFLSYHNAQLMIQELSDTDGPEWKTGPLEYPFGRGINFQINTPDIDMLVASLKKHDYPLRREVWDSWHKVEDKLVSCRQILVQDPDGYLLRFSQDIGLKPLEGK